MRFWDSSALVPLVIDEAPRAKLLDLLDQDAVMVVWWGTPVEVVSALARHEREGSLTLAETTQALGQLRALSGIWQEILATQAVRSVAQRLLRTHALQAADSLQLAAATIAAENEPATLEFVSLDARLNEAATREGFRVTNLP